MQLHFDFGNGTPPVNFNAEMEQATPLELFVPSHDSTARRALALYVQSLNYLFRGVSNYASGDIIRVAAEKGWFGRVEKNRDAVEWDAITDRTFVVIYDITLHSVTEHMYVADGVKSGGINKQFKGVDPLWIEELMNPNPRALKENIISSIVIATDFLKKYRLSWGFNGNEGLSILDSKGSIVQLNDVQDDESYVLICLLYLLMSKGIHTGVFMVDCRGFSDALLSAFIKSAKVFFGDAYIFFYNVPTACSVPRYRLELPNFVAR